MPVLFFAAYRSLKAVRREPLSGKLWCALLISVPATLLAALLFLFAGGELAGTLLRQPF